MGMVRSVRCAVRGALFPPHRSSRPHRMELIPLIYCGHCASWGPRRAVHLASVERLHTVPV